MRNFGFLEQRCLGCVFHESFSQPLWSCKEWSSHVLQCHFWIDSFWGRMCRPSTLSRALIPSPLETIRLPNIEPKDPKASFSAIAGGKQIAVVIQDIMPWFSAWIFSRAVLFEPTASRVPSLECNQVGAKKLQEDAESVCPYKAQWTVARSCWVLYGAWNPPTMLQMHLLTATTIFIYCKLYTLDVSIYLGRLLSLSNIILIMFAFNLFHGWCSAARIFPCGSCLHLFTVLGKQRRFYWGAMLLCCFVYLLMGVGKLNGITSVLGIQLTWSTFQQTSQ